MTFVNKPNKHPRRPQLGAPHVSVNTPGCYLRHRVAVTKADKIRRRVLWLRRTAGVALLFIFYFALGRDLVHLATAKRDAFGMLVRRDTQRLLIGIKNLASAPSQAAPEDMSPAALTAGALLSEHAGEENLDQLLNAESK